MKDKVNKNMFTAFCCCIRKRDKKAGFRAVQGYVNSYIERHELNEQQQQTLDKILKVIKP